MRGHLPFLQNRMKTLRDYTVSGALYVNDTGIEAQVSDQVTLFLDTEAEPGFPESIVATIQHPIVKVQCGSATSYILEYNEADLNGAASLLRPGDIVDATVVSGVTVVADELNAEIANRIADVNAEESRALAAELVLQNAIDAEESRALAAEALLAPKASPTFTGTVVLPSTTSIGTVTNTEIGYLDGVTSSIQVQLGTKASSASPTFTGNVTLGDTANMTFDTATGTKIGTSTTQKFAFHNATPVVQRAGAAQEAVVTTAATNSTPYGFTTAAQANSIVALVNELRAALVEKGLIKGTV